MSPRLSRWVGPLAVAAALAVLGYFYLLPGSRHLLQGSSRAILTDGGDAVTAPSIYWMLIDAVHRDPSRLLYGTIYTELMNPPDGWGLWIPWHERILILLGSKLAPIEVVPNFVAWVLMVVDGLAFYAFGRVEGWRRPVAAAFGLAFAFSVYTRARAFVHTGLVGLYALPLAFVGLRLTQRARRPRDLVVPALVLLGCATSSHYYILMIAAVSPLLLWFFVRGVAPGTRLRGVARLAAAAAPAILFIGYNLVVTVPPEMRGRNAVHRPPVISKWLEEFGARPSDYLVGDIAAAETPADWNPLRRKLNAYARANVAPSNLHERSNGIRWSVLAGFAALAAAMLVPRARRRLPPELRHAAGYFLVFAGCMFALSLPPSFLELETELGPARLVHALFPNFRIPCRYGAFAHFGVLAAVGWGVHVLLERSGIWSRRRGPLAVALLLPLIMILDYPPAQPLPEREPMPSIAPIEQASPDRDGECGTGLFFPYSAANDFFAHEVEFYGALQRLRGTTCRLLSSPEQNPTSERLRTLLGHDAFARAAQRPAVEARLVSLARCSKLDWMVFEGGVPAPTRDRVCFQAGGRRIGDDGCRLPGPSNDLRPIAECLPP